MGRYSAYDLIDGRATRQGADSAFFNSVLMLEGDLDRLIAVAERRAAIMARQGRGDDPEIDLWLDLPRVGSRTGTFGEP